MEPLQGKIENTENIPVPKKRGRKSKIPKVDKKCLIIEPIVTLLTWG